MMTDRGEGVCNQIHVGALRENTERLTSNRSSKNTQFKSRHPHKPIPHKLLSACTGQCDMAPVSV